MQIDFIFQIAVLIMSVVIHEVSHGYMAYYLGDPTAKYQDRLTINPFKHLDIIGSLIVPVLCYMTGGFIFGWAKPVPYNPHNLRPGRWSEALVAAAGPASNLFLAIVFGVFLRFYALGASANPAVIHITALIVFINIILMVFNLVPLAPLDGSKIFYAIFPERMYQFRSFFERYGFMLVLIFIFFGWQYVAPLAGVLFKLITGVGI
ncbi:MAG: site-2 protease family protein [Minisyncoccia bacterium]